LIKRIGFFTHTASISGPNNSLIQLVKKLDKLNYESIVYFPSSGEAINEFKRLNVKCRVIKNKRIERNPFLYPIYLYELIITTFSLIRFINKDQLDIIHINTSVTPFPGIAAKLVGVPIIWHVRESLNNNMINTLYLRLISHLAIRIIAVSDSVSRELIKRTNVPRVKLLTIYNGIEVKDYQLNYDKKEKRRLLGLPIEKTLIAVPAFLHPGKGHLVLLKAVKHLIIQKRIKNFLILIIGNDPSIKKDYYELLRHFVIKNNIDSNVRFLGKRKDIPDLLYISEIVCLPSVFPDPFPRTVLEGMAAGKPIVASNTGGIPEMIVDKVTGLLVNPNDSEALSIALMELIENKNKSVWMGEKGKGVVKEKFNSVIHAKKIQVVYLAVSGKNESQPSS
jgi:glycosyltransferase involved in cell wall biosynthesis